MNSNPRDKVRGRNPRENSNFLSSLFLLYHFFQDIANNIVTRYMLPIFYQSFKKELTQDDLFEPLDEHKSQIIGEQLQTVWNRYRKKYKKWALHLAIIRVFAFELLMTGLLFLFKEILTVVFIPILIGKLVSYFGQTALTQVISHAEAYYYGIGLIFCLSLERIISHPSMMWMLHVAMKMRISCSALVYRKTLRLSKNALAQTTVGHIVNLLSNDVSKFDQHFVQAHFAWVAPIQSAVAVYFLYQNIGVACFPGVGFLLMFLPLQMLMAKGTSILRMRTALRTDERVRLMNEIISGIQVIKMYTWEKPFAKLVAAIRSQEIRSIRANKIIAAFIYSIEVFASRAAIYISLITFYMMGQQVTAEKAYGITAIINVIKTTMTFRFTASITALAEVNISIQRIKQFLDYDELIQKVTIPRLTTQVKDHDVSIVGARTNPKISLNSVTAQWTTEQSNTLNDITFSINNPQLFAIIGPVGSGKSSLLNVILSELPILMGEMDIEGTISFASQEPWLFSASVRQNILFGDDYDEFRYRRVCKVCALESDFAQLPHGDKTLVGDRGNALSGGQKARINLARAIYKKADIYLLDDPLSAVDTNVGKKLFNECIRGFLVHKICILITHQLQYLKNAEKILILKNGHVAGLGTYHELQNSGLDFAQLLEEFQSPDDEMDLRRAMNKSRQNSINSECDDIGSLIEDELYDEPTMEKEKMTTGVIDLDIYTKYFRAGGNYCIIFTLILAFLLFEAVSRISDYYITYWVNTEQYFTSRTRGMNATSIANEISQNEARHSLIFEYTAVIAVTIILAILNNLFVFLFFMRASINLHDYIFEQLSKAKMKFFNANSIGRILNRFSKDIGIVDEYLPNIITEVTSTGLLMFGTIVLTSIVNPMLLPPAVVLIFVFYLLRIVSLKTSRSVKRIEAITRSPILTQMTTTMSGLTTIRAFSAENMLIQEFDCNQDLHSSAWFLFIASTRAFGFWLDLSCVIFISLVIIALLAVNTHMYGGDLGLIITQYIGLMGVLQWGMRQWSELENQMTSVERVLEYTKLDNEPERPFIAGVPDGWPKKGRVQFKDVSMRYFQNDPPVLKHLEFTVFPGEKIGIVGRTGAGKSSIIVSMFQLYELEGSILIDDLDTTRLPLDLVRSKISIIPQEPILFSGTMLKNLDPFDEFTDNILWNALEQVELKEVVANMPEGLHTRISEGGSNFSLGQRQLVCLARAIIRNNRILVLDEATANVDPHTDALIQQTIRRKFAHCTVLTIAHRLHTVMDSDRILVMDAGRVVEFDSPHILLQNQRGVFREMVETTGAVTSRNLKEIAENAYNFARNY